MKGALLGQLRCLRALQPVLAFDGGRGAWRKWHAGKSYEVVCSTIDGP